MLLHLIMEVNRDTAYSLSVDLHASVTLGVVHRCGGTVGWTSFCLLLHDEAIERTDRFFCGEVLSFSPKNVEVGIGFAWHYKKYQHEQNPEDRRLYADAETKARDERLGLWRENNPNPPWEHRRLYR